MIFHVFLPVKVHRVPAGFVFGFGFIGFWYFHDFSGSGLTGFSFKVRVLGFLGSRVGTNPNERISPLSMVENVHTSKRDKTLSIPQMDLSSLRYNRVCEGWTLREVEQNMIHGSNQQISKPPLMI